ncbi:hypothetical protein RYX36_000137, partial [Vicia faba]
ETRSRFIVNIEPEDAVNINPLDGLLSPVQCFTLRDSLTLLQWEELVARFTIARKMRFVYTDVTCPFCEAQ